MIQTFPKKILGIITARGGSKGIPGKNIKELAGKPLIAYTIEAAQKSGVFNRIILSTDCPMIARIAKKYGCEVPFLRPDELAKSDTTSLSVVQHAVDWLQKQEEYEPEYIMILQPTSPLRRDFHIRDAVELLNKTGADSVLSVAEIPENYRAHKAMQINDGKLTLINGDPIYKRIARRQDIPKSYWSVGSIYLFKLHLVSDSHTPNFYGEHTAPYIIEPHYIADINEEADWQEAERALHRIISQK